MSEATEQIAKDVFNLDRNDFDTALEIVSRMLDTKDVDEMLYESIIRSFDDDEKIVAAIDELTEQKKAKGTDGS